MVIMILSSPITTMYFLMFSLVIFVFLIMLSLAGLIQVPVLIFKLYAIGFAFLFFWWPLDMLINWEKRTDTANQKDRVLICFSLSVILFVFPYYFYATPFYPTLMAAVGLGLFLPGLIALAGTIKLQQPVISPGLVHRTAMAAEKAQAFNNRFPRARQYILGYADGTNKQAKLVLHERLDYERFNNASIDYVLTVPVDRKSGAHIEGLEKLECYLFINDEGKAGVAFLPVTNFQRVLDFGFGDDEIDGAVIEAKRFEQKWPSIDFEPLPVQHFRGQYVRMK